jgi:hypothetical protein
MLDTLPLGDVTVLLKKTYGKGSKLPWLRYKCNCCFWCCFRLLQNKKDNERHNN